MVTSMHIAYYACTDVRIAYSVVTRYAFCNCALNAAKPSLAQVPTKLCRLEMSFPTVKFGSVKFAHVTNKIILLLYTH